MVNFYSSLGKDSNQFRGYYKFWNVAWNYECCLKYLWNIYHIRIFQWITYYFRLGKIIWGVLNLKCIWHLEIYLETKYICKTEQEKKKSKIAVKSARAILWNFKNICMRNFALVYMHKVIFSATYWGIRIPS